MKSRAPDRFFILFLYVEKRHSKHSHPLHTSSYPYRIKKAQARLGLFLRCSFLCFNNYYFIYSNNVRCFAVIIINNPCVTSTSLCDRFCHKALCKEVAFCVSICKLLRTLIIFLLPG